MCCLGGATACEPGRWGSKASDLGCSRHYRGAPQLPACGSMHLLLSRPCPQVTPSNTQTCTWTPTGSPKAAAPTVAPATASTVVLRAWCPPLRWRRPSMACRRWICHTARSLARRAWRQRPVAPRSPPLPTWCASRPSSIPPLTHKHTRARKHGLGGDGVEITNTHRNLNPHSN